MVDVYKIAISMNIVQALLEAVSSMPIDPLLQLQLLHGMTDPSPYWTVSVNK